LLLSWLLSFVTVIFIAALWLDTFNPFFTVSSLFYSPSLRWLLFNFVLLYNFYSSGGHRSWLSWSHNHPLFTLLNILLHCIYHIFKLLSAGIRRRWLLLIFYFDASFLLDDNIFFIKISWLHWSHLLSLIRTKLIIKIYKLSNIICINWFLKALRNILLNLFNLKFVFIIFIQKLLFLWWVSDWLNDRRWRKRFTIRIHHIVIHLSWQIKLWITWLVI